MRRPLNIVYLGGFNCPPNDAASARVFGISRALRMAGHSVTMLPRSRVGPGMSEHAEADGFPYVLRPPGGRIGSLMGEIWGGDYLSRLRALSPRPDLVIFYGGFVPMCLRVLAHCRRHGIAVASDVVECYDPSHLPLGRFGPARWMADAHFHWFTPHTRHVICISRWLNRYYQSRGCHTVQVPPMLDVQAAPARAVSSSMRFTYAGDPGRKDLLGNVVAGIAELRAAGIPASIRLVGVTPEAVRASLAFCGQTDVPLEGLAEFSPRVTSDKVPALLAECDFLPLLRPPLRYAQAGFPTKVTEAMASGLPVIANLTSNLDDYLRDGVNAFVAADHSKDAFVAAARRAWACRSSWPQMRAQARITAEESFDCRVHVPALDAFVRRAASHSP
jgi:glycosyltransferase involved in cell wall biosynthesis